MPNILLDVETVDGYKRRIAELEAKLEAVPDMAEAMKEIREIYAGMEGFIPETCPEGYQQMIIKQMYTVAVDALKKAGVE